MTQSKDKDTNKKMKLSKNRQKDANIKKDKKNV